MAYEKLLLTLADVPTPAGPTQHQLGADLAQITSVKRPRQKRDRAIELVMTSRSRSLAVWKTVSLLGAALIAVGTLAGYIDVAAHFRCEFISNDFDLFTLAVLVGTALSFVGFIGWSAQPGVRRRGLTVGLILVAPWIGLLLGAPIGKTNIHDPAALVMLLILPAAILTLALAVMHGAKHNR